MAARSLARSFFEKAIEGGSAFLRKLVEDRTPETEWLDFKCGDRLDDTQTKITWSRALCGFANNEGGVLIWGIDARFDESTKTDVASEVKLVPKPEQLRDRVRQLHPMATDPPVVGVDSQAIFDEGVGGPGFVVSYIPESDVKPLRAELMEGKPYMLRIGDAFKNPSPAILRNLFFPRSSARLHIGVLPEWEGIEKGTPRSTIEIRHLITVHNAGVVSARDLFVVMQTIPLGLPIELPYGTSKTDVETRHGIGIEVSRPLHPSSNLPLCCVRHEVPVGTRTSTGPNLLVPRPTTFEALFQVFASDMQPLNVRATVNEYDVDHKIRIWAEPVVGDRHTR